MKTTYRTNFEKIKAEYPDVFNALKNAAKELKVECYLIGAQARNIWMGHLDLRMRTTNDIDYYIYVANREVWDKLNKYLVQSEKFKRDIKLPYRFSKDGQMMDVLPFGGIEEKGEVILENPLMHLSVIGSHEVTSDAVTIDDYLKAITLPGTCILKLVAYHENPGRIKDFSDFVFFAENYYEIAGEDLFTDEHLDLLTGGLEYNIACTRLLGRHMAPSLNGDVRLKKIILDVLSRKLYSFSLDAIDQMYSERDSSDQIVLHLKLIAETVRGIEERLTLS